jgi:hypothetical protein
MLTSAGFQQAGRSTLIARLHALASWLEANPDVPVSPYSDIIVNYFTTLDEARAVREAAPGGWRKQTSPADNYITYEHGETDGTGKWKVFYALHVAKSGSDTCERVQVGTKHVEEHDEPVFEWKCDA